MAQTSRIKTPFKQHLHRFRLGALPIISFVACVALTLWLWERQVSVGSILGEVEAHTAADGAPLLFFAGEYRTS